MSRIKSIPEMPMLFPYRPTNIIGRFRKAKFLATTIGLSMACQLIYPNVCFAVTAGPSSPEFSSFEPVATTNMVNEFTGQFTYNLPVLEIPGAAGGGYALSLAYHAGDGPEAEASWVGQGWTLNPGSIIRNKRGLPDDFKGQSIKYYNSAPKNWTIAATGNLGAEVFSGLAAGSLSATVRYNYYKGFGVSSGIGLSGLRGFFSLNYSNTDGTGSFSPQINPAALLSYVSDALKSDPQGALSQVSCQNDKKIFQGCGQTALTAVNLTAVPSAMAAGVSTYINYFLVSTTSPYNLTPYEGESYGGYLQATGDPLPAPVGVDGGLNISYVSQKNIAERFVPSFGYMYSGNAAEQFNNDSAQAEAMMDYTVENPSTYNQRDKYLPVPTSTPDAYMVSGEGLSGSFRMYNDRIGIFSPNFVKSKTTTNHYGVDAHLGLDVGVGGEVTKDGEHTLEVKSSWDDGNGNTSDSWFVPYEYKDSSHIQSENMFFRFGNDLGGSVVYDNSDLPVAAAISGKIPNLPSTYKVKADRRVPVGNRRGGKASNVGYHTNRELTTFLGSSRPLAFEQRQDIHNLAGRADTVINPTIRDEIGEVSIVNEGGNRYTYGLPVYNGGETSLRKGLIGALSVPDRYIVHNNTTDKIVIGEEYTAPYVSQYLLTEITTPDYLDINANGPDKADFGGYTRFTYKRQYGSDDKTKPALYNSWYKWRTPYNGLTFAPNRLSDNTDDMGYYQSGYKEVYYLDSIQTKTHYAVFVTDTRNDGLDANVSEITASTSFTAKGTHAPRRLTKILLYAKSTTGGADKLIKTVNFDYNYECWPNNINSTGSNGKLTLKKVWFEYNGIVNALISPYIFEYQYPTSVAYPAEYSYIQTEMTGLVQNPSYSPYIDCWGNYIENGNSRRQLMKCWPNQAPSNTYDPAAWQLKRIILPSGGEIHVQYEQNTYSYVQDRPACALVSLWSTESEVASGGTYRLNLAELGITTSAEKDSLVSLINRTYHNQKIYFKFFYTLKSTSTATLGDCNGDYVEGYVNFTNCYKNAGGDVVVQVSDLPQDACKDYVRHQIGGKLLDGSCSTSSFPGDVGLGGSGGVWGALSGLVSTFFSMVGTATTLTSICVRAKPELSYLRIPIPKKKGGGIRVKRLLMYNKGIDLNSPTLYGSQYIYDNESNGTSFGVATNEPNENKGENPLVTFLPKRGEQSNWDRLIAGKDREKFEGPISWNILPAASVGYSRIIKKNIHQIQATTTGYTVIDYNTVKDYPFDGYYPALGRMGTTVTEAQNVQDAPSVDFGIFHYDIKTGVRGSQGYCFIQNQMHGQIKQISDYRGAYSAARFYDIFKPPVPVSQKTYQYFSPGEQIPMFDFNKWKVYYDQPGKEMDMTIDRRCVWEHSEETRKTGDITAGIAIIPLAFAIAFPVTSVADQQMNSIVVNKTIHYPAILKQMSVMKDGYYQVSDYTAFDPVTAKPVLTCTYDGFDKLKVPQTSLSKHNGKYTAYNVPASAFYPAMGQKAWNDRYSYWNSSIPVAGSGMSYTVFGVNGAGIFAPGDMIALHYHISGSTYDGVAIAHVTGTSGADLQVAPTMKYNTSLAGAGYYKVDVIHSGYTNQLGSSMDGLTTYGGAGKGIPQFIADVNYALHEVQYNSSGGIDIFMDDYNFMLGDPDTCDKAHSIKKISIYNSGGVIVCIAYPQAFNLLAFGYYVGASPAAAIGPGPMWNMFTDMLGHDWQKKICDTVVHVNVIKAQTTTYSDKWAYDTVAYGLDTVNFNRYETGLRGKWRPFETYVYRDTVVKGNKRDFDERNYRNAGTINFLLSRWDSIHLDQPTKWIRSNHIDAYSPNGHATQEYDAENVYSAAKYGYNGFLPYMVAQNSQVAAMHFESFENVYGSGATAHAEDRMFIDPTKIVNVAHTGLSGYATSPGNTITLSPTLALSGISLNVRFWARVTGNPASIFSVSSSPSGLTPMSAVQIARSGEWALYEAKWQNPGGAAPTNVSVTIKNSSNANIVLDDIRINPREAKTTTYVYDVGSYKLSAVLDDQHMATYYQYNGEGKLVRTLVETTRGIKTAEEAQYHTPERKR